MYKDSKDVLSNSEELCYIYRFLWGHWMHCNCTVAKLLSAPLCVIFSYSGVIFEMCLIKFHLLRNPNHNSVNEDHTVAVYLNKFFLFIDISIEDLR